MVVGSMISNIVDPGFSSTSFACLIHLSSEMLADEILMHFTNKHQVSFSYYFKFDRIVYVLVTVY